MAVVLTLVQTKQIRINIHKLNNATNTVQKIQNTINALTHITKTLTHTHTHTHTHITKQVKITTVQDIPKLNTRNTIKYPQYKVTLMYMALLSPRTSLNFEIKSLHINHVSSHHITSLHITTLHITSLIYTQSPLEFPCFSCL